MRFLIILVLATTSFSAMAQHKAGDYTHHLELSYNKGVGNYEIECGVPAKNTMNGFSGIYRFAFYSSSTVNIGGGGGVNYYSDYVAMPFYFVVGCEIPRKKITPFFRGRTGATYLFVDETQENTGVTSEFEIGADFKMSKKNKLSLSIGYESFILKDQKNNSQYSANSCNFFSNNQSFVFLRIGFAFDNN